MVGLSMVGILYFPVIAEEKGMTLGWIGAILGLRPLMGLIFAHYFRELVLDIGIERTVFISALIYALTYVGLGVLPYIDNYGFFFTLSLVISTLQGITFAGLTIGE